MLDVLLEGLMDLITGKQPKEGAPGSQGQRPAGQGRSSPTAARRTGEAGERKAVTLEDLIKRMTGMEEAPPPQPKPRRPVRREEPRPAPPPQPAATAKRSIVAEALDNAAAEEAQPVPRAEPKVPGYAAGLRGNPRAARDAFVYGEIFGKPLADRDHRQSP